MENVWFIGMNSSAERTSWNSLMIISVTPLHSSHIWSLYMTTCATMSKRLDINTQSSALTEVDPGSKHTNCRTNVTSMEKAHNMCNRFLYPTK